MDSIDKLLAEIKAEYDQPTAKVTPTAAPLPQPTQKSAPLIDNVLSQLKSEFDEQDKAEEELKIQQLLAEEIRQQQLKQKQLEALQSRAKAWLEKLDSLSTEGLWFEQFAQRYPSKLAAATDYLQTIEEPNSY